MKKSTALWLLSLPLIVGALVALWIYGRPAYHRAKEARFARQTETALAQHDYRAAWLSAQQSVRLNHTNPEPVRILVDLAMRARLPSELDLRRRLVELDPSLTNQLQFVSAALRLEKAPFPLAAQTLADLAATADASPHYHTLAAELAVRRQLPKLAAQHFERAAKLEPHNRLHEINAASLRLAQGDAPTIIAQLEAAADDPDHGAFALRLLVAEHVRRDRLTNATACSERLLAQPAATLSDRLRHLGILRAKSEPAFLESLAQVQAGAATNASEIFQVSAWLVTHEHTDLALDWLGSLPPEVRAQQPVPVALADAQLAAQQWAAAERWLDTDQWGDLDYLRLAFLSETARQLQQSLPADNRWRLAVRDAGERLAALTYLAALARDWRRDRERAEVLWLISERFPRQRWALAELNDLYEATRNLRGLARVYQAKLAYEPDNPFLRNNLAVTHLLLNQAIPEAAETARSLIAAFPTNPVIASTHAFALHKLGRTEEGLEVYHRVPPEFLNQPGIAVYYAALLAAAGQTDEARIYAATARRGRLFPEELQLLTNVDSPKPEPPPARQP